MSLRQMVEESAWRFEDATLLLGGVERRVPDVYHEAIGFLQLGRHAAARSRFQALVDAAPVFAEGYFQLARILFEEGDHAGALEHAASAAEMHPVSQHYQVLHVACLAALGFIDEAAAVSRRRGPPPDGFGGEPAPPSRPGDADARSAVEEFLRGSLGLILPGYVFVGGRLHRTAALLEDGLRGLAAGAGARADESEAALRALLAHSPGLCEARFWLAEHWRRQGRLDEAIALCEEGERLRVADWPLQLELGVLLAQIGRSDKALSHFEEAALVNDKLPIYSPQHLNGEDRTALADWYRGLLAGLPVGPGSYSAAWRLPEPPAIGRSAMRDRRPLSALMRVALSDIARAASLPQVWWMLARRDVVSRYRRTALGPWWVVMGTGIALVGMAVVWSALFGMGMKQFFPYLSAGYVVWGCVSSIVTEGCSAFVDGHAQAIQKNVDVPKFIHVLRLVARNVLLFLHSFSIVVVGGAVFGIALTPATLLALPGFALLVLTLLGVALLFGVLGTRYRDFGPAVGALLGVVFFVTPVMWDPHMLGGKAYIAQFNPLTHLIGIVRDPVLGAAPPLASWAVAGAVCVVVWLVALVVFAKARHRIVYWL